MAAINGTSANQAINGLPRFGNEAVSNRPEQMTPAYFVAAMFQYFSTLLRYNQMFDLSTLFKTEFNPRCLQSGLNSILSIDLFFTVG